MAGPSRPSLTTAELLRVAFGLTGVEAAVALLIAADSRGIAARHGARYATVRAQIQAILGKTRCHRIPDVALRIGRVVAS